MTVVVRAATYADGDVAAAHAALAARVLSVVAHNCKKGPFTSTAGRVLPCAWQCAHAAPARPLGGAHARAGVPRRRR